MTKPNDQDHQVHREWMKDDARDLWLMRCECWRHMMMGGIADNNGWFPADKYPHASYCKARQA